MFRAKLLLKNMEKRLIFDRWEPGNLIAYWVFRMKIKKLKQFCVIKKSPKSYTSDEGRAYIVWNFRNSTITNTEGVWSFPRTIIFWNCVYDYAVKNSVNGIRIIKNNFLR